MYKVKYDEFMKEVERTKEELKRRTCVEEIGRIIWFVNVGDNVIHTSLNIAGTGIISPKAASRIADCIKEAAELAENFKYNGYVIG